MRCPGLTPSLVGDLACLDRIWESFANPLIRNLHEEPSKSGLISRLDKRGSNLHSCPLQLHQYHFWAIARNDLQIIGTDLSRKLLPSKLAGNGKKETIWNCPIEFSFNFLFNFLRSSNPYQKKERCSSQTAFFVAKSKLCTLNDW